jgi:hypothetical protein
MSFCVAVPEFNHNTMPVTQSTGPYCGIHLRHVQQSAGSSKVIGNIAVYTASLHIFRHGNHLQFTMLSLILKMISLRHFLLLFVLLPRQLLRFPHFRRSKTDSLSLIRTEKQWIQPELMALSVEWTSLLQRENLKLEPRMI